MAKQKHVSCQEEHKKRRTSFLKRIENFDEAESQETNHKVKNHLKKMVDLIGTIESNEVVQHLQETILNYVRQMQEKAKGKPTQAFVFYFNRDSGEIFLTTYAQVTTDSLINTELSRSATPDNIVVNEVGPIKIPRYDAVREDVLYEDEIDGYEIEFENDELNELLILQTYKIFEQAFWAITPALLYAHLKISFPLYCYIQEHDGGYANLIRKLEN